MIKKIINHISTILKHKWFVFVYCKQMGVTWRGIKHDLSKFHPTEFLESLKYYQKGSSPIPRCKKDKGYSNAWFHHKGHNDHHYEYWIDNLNNGGTPIKMPYDAMIEMLADWFAAGRTYNGKSFSFADELNWMNKELRIAKIHPVTSVFIYELTKILSKGASPKDIGGCYKLIKDYYNDLTEEDIKNGLYL